MEKKIGRGMIFTIVYDKHDTDTCSFRYLWLIDSLKISISTGKRIMISQYMYSTSHFSAIHTVGVSVLSSTHRQEVFELGHLFSVVKPLPYTLVLLGTEVARFEEVRDLRFRGFGFLELFVATEPVGREL